MSIRKLGSPTCWHASPSIRFDGSMSCCRGTGVTATDKVIRQLEPKMTRIRSAPDAYGAHGAAFGSDGASARRSGGGSDRGRAGGRACGGQDTNGQIVRAQAACAQTVSRSSAPRAYRDRRAGKLSLLRVGEAVEAG